MKMRNKICLAKDTIDVLDIRKLAVWLLQNPIPKLTKGELTIIFEEKFARTIGMKYAVFVNSGSSANLLAVYSLIATNKLKNKKVVVSSLSWITTVSPVIQFGLDLILCDINLNDLSVDLNHLENIFIEQSPACLFLVSVLGLTPEMDKITELCEKYDVLLLMDCCESLGSKYKDKNLEQYGLMSTTSMYYGHIISCVEGGLIFTDDEKLYNYLKMLRSHGWDRDLNENAKQVLKSKWNVSGFNALYTFYTEGFNVRNTEIGAFLGLIQLDKLNDFVIKRNKNYLLYNEFIKNDYWKPNCSEYGFVSNLGYPVIHPNKNKIIEALTENNVEVRPLISGSMGEQPFYIKKYGRLELPNVSIVDKFGLYLPNHPMLSEDDIELMCDVINELCQ